MESKKKSKNINDVKINTSAFGIMKDVKEKQARGETVDEYTKEAIETIEFASNLMDAILSGRQIDLEFYRRYTKNAIANIRRMDKRNGIKRTIRSRIEDDKV
jgi:ribosomal 50S subunit-associated protein YjgA (DUF615 family)